MNNLILFKSKSLLLCGIILGGVMLPALSANGQCVANHYLKRHGSSAYQASGLNPYTGRYVFSVYFTPLQNQLYSDVVPGCATCAGAVNPNVDMGEAVAPDANSNGEETRTDEFSSDQKLENIDTRGASTVIPNHRIIAPARSGESTPSIATAQAKSVNWAMRKQNRID